MGKASPGDQVLCSVFNGSCRCVCGEQKHCVKSASLIFVAAVFTRIGEIVEDGGGEELTFSDLAKAAVKFASVASTEASFSQPELASVNRPTRRNKVLPIKSGFIDRYQFPHLQIERCWTNHRAFQFDATL